MDASFRCCGIFGLANRWLEDPRCEVHTLVLIRGASHRSAYDNKQFAAANYVPVSRKAILTKSNQKQLQRNVSTPGSGAEHSRSIIVAPIATAASPGTFLFFFLVRVHVCSCGNRPLPEPPINQGTVPASTGQGKKGEE